MSPLRGEMAPLTQRALTKWPFRGRTGTSECWVGARDQKFWFSKYLPAGVAYILNFFRTLERGTLVAASRASLDVKMDLERSSGRQRLEHSVDPGSTN